MATGYTSSIEKGISFKDFTMQCARAFGALIEMRDEPMDKEAPEKFEPSTYHSEALEKSENKLVELQNMNYIDICDAAELEYEESIERELKWSKERNELKQKYNDMLFNVENWQPPTPDHNDLKRFMIEQIESSIKFDCHNHKSDIKKLDIKKLSGDEWMEKEVNSAIRNIKYHSEGHIKEIERIKRRNKWVKDLRESLSNV